MRALVRWCTSLVLWCLLQSHQNWMVAICPSIPAYAGKYVGQRWFCPHRLVNPRLRGENDYQADTDANFGRPIPACVGKTPNDDKHTAGPEAHPHLHGKNREFEKLHHLWLIPAFAGNGDGVSSRAVIMLTVPHFRCQVYGAVRVNPNLRGKTHCIYLQIRRQPGQSPPCGKNSVIRCPGTV